MTGSEKGKWTPGPWKWDSRGQFLITADTPDDGGFHEDAVLALLGGGRPSPANARLLAAAPELVEALRDVLDGLGALSNPTELCGFAISEERAREIVGLLSSLSGEAGK